MRRRKLTSEVLFEDDNNVNLTPLIDVLFVILVAFIIIAPMLDVDSVELSDGGGHLKNELHQTSDVQIVVKSNNQIMLNKKEISLANLESALKECIERSPEKKIELFHDQNASFGTYQSIKNAAESSGYKELQIVLKPST